VRGGLEAVGVAQDAGIAQLIINLPLASIMAIVSGVQLKPFSLSSVAFTSTPSRASFVSIGLASKRRTGFLGSDIDRRVRCRTQSALGQKRT
jgi:hypothetical protein